MQRFQTVRILSALAGCAALSIVGLSDARAQSLSEALALAYENNPTLNAARAQLRATDEGLPQARAGNRPTISATGDIGLQYSATDPFASSRTDSVTHPSGVAINLRQDIFRGFRTRNAVRAAINNIYSGRFSLVNQEQNTFLDGVTAYMDVVRDSAVVRLNVQNVNVLRQQSQSSRDRFEVGEVTRTDVAQADARVAEAVSTLLQAESNLISSQAVFEEIIGRKPRQLRFPSLRSLGIPKGQSSALQTARSIHPAIKAAQHNIEAAEYNVKVEAGALLPTVSLEASAQRRWEPSANINTSDSASIVGRISIPIYQGGAVSSRVRQAKQNRTVAQIEADRIRRQVHAAVISAWAGLEAARGQIRSDQSQIEAAQLALDGVREEELVGQRTTLDVLDAQQEVLRARVNLTTSQRNQVVAAYSLLAAMGKLTADQLGLRVARYVPEVHTKAVQDKWYGLRTPGGQ